MFQYLKTLFKLPIRHNELVRCHNTVNSLAVTNAGEIEALKIEIATLQRQVRELATRPIERVVERQIEPVFVPAAKPRNIERPVMTANDHIAIQEVRKIYEAFAD